MSGGSRSVQPILLALDTSTRTIGLSLYTDSQVLGEFIWTSPDYHTVELAPAVAELLEKSRVSVGELAALAVALGPGSFTGLRIGLALAKGLVLAQKIPLVGVPTLDILAAAQPLTDPDLNLAAILQAGRGRFAVGWYRVQEGHWQANAQLEVLTLDQLIERIQSPTLVCGEFTDDERLQLLRKRDRKTNPNIHLASPALSLRRPSFLAELGWQRWRAGQLDDPASLSPIYLHYNDPIPG